MSATILISGIGGSIGIDVARSLRRDSSLRLVGTDANPWAQRQTVGLVDRSVLLPRADRQPEAYHRSLCELIAEESVDFAFVNPDPELEGLAGMRATLPCPTSMPPIDTVAVSLDKASTVARVGQDDAFPATLALDGDDVEADVRRAFDTLGAPLWIRARVGASGRGSLTVETPAEALAWIAYWNSRGKEYGWVLAEFLPGANINWTGLYVEGELRVSAAMERLRYFLGAAAASGVSGQVAQCATVAPEPYREVCDRVIRALDDRPHGLYSVDLRHDRDDRARVTEVNPRLAGRPWLYTNAGVNLALAAARALTGQDIGDAVGADGLAVGMQLYRQLDIEPVVGFPES